MYIVKWFARVTVAFCPWTHQYFAVGSVLAGQADPHPLIIPVSLACLPTRLSGLVSWKTMRAVCRRWVIRMEDVLGQVACYLLATVSTLSSRLYYLFPLNVQMVYTQFEILHIKHLLYYSLLLYFCYCTAAIKYCKSLLLKVESIQLF